MKTGRASGILLHLTSLPGPFGIGDLGPEAFRFADWLAQGGQKIWQVLPLGPVGYGESPYQLFSVFAGNPMLISPERLLERGWLAESDLSTARSFPQDRVEFEKVLPWKTRLFQRAFARFPGSPEFDAFTRENAGWLDAFSRFMALKEANGGVSWRDWNPSLEADPRAIEFHKFLQFEFFREWRELKSYCANRGIAIMGDVAIYAAMDSADVWSRPDLFRFDAVAGVPPDYFSATGQLWGNPIYRWDRMKAEGYAWWIARMRAALDLFDLVRLDHFRGFEAYWQVPAGETTAIHGEWIKGPGAGIFQALEAELGKLPLVAENLGVITPAVEAIRHQSGFPGMAILQFAFGNDPQADSFKPHNYEANLVAYSGTHDNDTANGWWRSEGGDSTRPADDVLREKALARSYLNTDGSQIHLTFIRALIASVADTVLFPMQDVLGLGSEARMNTPATASGNWRWRMRGDAATAAGAERLRNLTKLYGR
ncbi:MAG TPA: 4-alpha-glucanotransferase [Bryobacteraceae bacterium]|nr:4-alpha-glucanotransferase [Bryobacteraceae bacterium]